MNRTLVQKVGAPRLRWWVVCPFCMYVETPACNECLGTDRDPMPWSELFPGGRKEKGTNAHSFNNHYLHARLP